MASTNDLIFEMVHNAYYSSVNKDIDKSHKENLDHNDNESESSTVDDSQNYTSVSDRSDNSNIDNSNIDNSNIDNSNIDNSNNVIINNDVSEKENITTLFNALFM